MRNLHVSQTFVVYYKSKARAKESIYKWVSDTGLVVRAKEYFDEWKKKLVTKFFKTLSSARLLRRAFLTETSLRLCCTFLQCNLATEATEDKSASVTQTEVQHYHLLFSTYIIRETESMRTFDLTIDKARNNHTSSATSVHWRSFQQVVGVRSHKHEKLACP